MQIPPSSYFTPLSLANVFNANRQTVADVLKPPAYASQLAGLQALQGIPFILGTPGTQDVLLLDKTPIEIAVDDQQATYVLFLHAVEDRKTIYQAGFADDTIDGNELGDLVADYTLEYTDGSTAVTPIQRRFAIQQSHIRWGASPFSAVPAISPSVFSTVTEVQALGHVSPVPYGAGETRHNSGRTNDNLWLYALPNPHPEKPIRRILLIPQQERALVYAISTTQISDHPLRPGLREKVRLNLPAGVTLNALGELEGVAIDLGVVISARGRRSIMTSRAG